MFWWRERLQPAQGDVALDLAFTDSAGGVGRHRFGALNLARHVGDADPEVAANRALLAAELGLPADRLRFMSQQHGREVAVASTSSPQHAPEVDALVSSEPDLALAVLVADCTPVLIADPRAGVIAAVHAGRPGAMSGVVGAAVEAMRDLGARSLRAVVGPSVCGRCYEVPAAMREDAARRSAVGGTLSWTGTPAIDVAAMVVEQLTANQVAVQWLRGCTRESPTLYSYRRDRVTGRFAGVMRSHPRDAPPREPVQ